MNNSNEFNLEQFKNKIKTELDTMIHKRIRCGDVYMNCKYHPCMAVAIGDDITGISLITGNETNCSRRYCSATKMKITLAMELVKHWKEFSEPITKSMIDTGWWENGDSNKQEPWSVIREALIKEGLQKDSLLLSKKYENIV